MVVVGRIYIAGGGPAGAAAAIAARGHGAAVTVFDRTTAPRHKVCGEFLSPQSAEVLDTLGVWAGFVSLGPHRMDRCILHLGKYVKEWTLSECAWGLSRFRLDALLLEKASACGAEIRRGEVFDPRGVSGLVIRADGRRTRAAAKDRLFGFKSHFDGPRSDAVELFFQECGYVGISGIEDGRTNVCGIARESVLRRYGFDFDEVVSQGGALSERLRPLRRGMRWLVTGPLGFAPPSADTQTYAAGDALGFIDPFTGTGILNALMTGRLAGIAAARSMAPAEHIEACRARLGRPFAVAPMLRWVAAHREAHWLSRLVPGEWLFRWTRIAGGAL